VTFNQEHLWPSLVEDYPDKPVESWWWYLGTIRGGKFGCRVELFFVKGILPLIAGNFPLS